MLSLGPLAFLNPWLLVALAALPVLWILLRATPPAPRRIAFPGVRLLLGMRDDERMPDRTPWWLLLLRLAMIAALIVAFARPSARFATRRSRTAGATSGRPNTRSRRPWKRSRIAVPGAYAASSLACSRTRWTRWATAERRRPSPRPAWTGST